MAKITLYLIICLLSFSTHYSQNNTTSFFVLHQKLNKAKLEKDKISILLEIESYHYDLSNKKNHQNAIDSAFFYATKALTISDAIDYQKGIGDSNIALSKIAKRKKKFDESEAYANKAIEVFKNGNKNDLANSYMALMSSKEEIREVGESIAIAQKALALYKETGNKKEEANTIQDIAFWNMTMGKMQKGKEELEQCLKIYKSIGFTEVQRTYSLIGIASTELGNFDEALKNQLEAIKIIERSNDKSLEAAEAYNYAAITYHQLKDLKSSNLYFQKAYQISKEYNDEAINTMILTNIVETFTQINRTKDALVYLKEMERDFDDLDDQSKDMLTLRCILVYTELKDFKSAEKYVKKAMIRSEKFNANHHHQTLFYPGIIKYLFETKNYDLARKYTNKYKELSIKNKNKQKLVEVHKMLFQLDSVQLKFASALKEYKLEVAYRDSLFNEAKNKELAGLQIKFDTEKKDKDLLLKEKQNKILNQQSYFQKEKLMKAGLFKKISIGSFIFFLVIIISLFRLYNIKQKNNRMLVSQKNEINQKNTILEKLVIEKEWLFKEIHHRVKNNLQMVMSLLSTQSHYLKDDSAVEAIKESQNRIHSMSLIHKKLYQSKSVISINMEIYIKELVEYFKSSYNIGQRIQFALDIEPVELDASQAVPVGLILNEAITNSIKHAFDDVENGLISIVLQPTNNNKLQLLIKDNGKGIKNDINIMQSDSLGMKLIRGLSDDLESVLLVENDNGLKISLEFTILKKLTDITTLENKL